MTASGGVISDYTDGPIVYRAHVFTSSGVFDVSAVGSLPTNVEYLVVAGGGSGGGGGQSGGGGAGGSRTNLPGVINAVSAPLTISTPFPVSADGGDGSGSYTVTVGGGGAGTGNNGPGFNNSIIFWTTKCTDGITGHGGGGGITLD